MIAAGKIERSCVCCTRASPEEATNCIRARVERLPSMPDLDAGITRSKEAHRTSATRTNPSGNRATRPPIPLGSLLLVVIGRSCFCSMRYTHFKISWVGGKSRQYAKETEDVVQRHFI